MNDLGEMLANIASVFAIVGGVYGAYVLVRQKIASRPYKKPLWMFAGTNDLRDSLTALSGRVVNFDTALDFSTWDEFSNRVASETEYQELLDDGANALNGARLPLYVLSKYQTLESFASLVVVLKNASRLQFSHGGTGVLQVLLNGRFQVEVRAYSGPSVEITLREQ